MKLKDLIKEDITLSGEIKLYHYSVNDLGDDVTFDPQKSFEMKSNWSMNDYKRSSVPRVFYYTDLNKTEKMVVKRSKSLYIGTISGSKILNVQETYDIFKKDQSLLKTKNINAFNVINESVDNYGNINFDLLLKTAKKYFSGVYYGENMNLPIVNLFVPLTLKKYNV